MKTLRWLLLLLPLGAWAPAPHEQDKHDPTTPATSPNNNPNQQLS